MRTIVATLLLLTIASVFAVARPSSEKHGPQLQRYLAAGAEGPVKVWVYFNGHGERNSAERATLISGVRLSDRSMERRVRRGRAPLVDKHDLPVSDDHVTAVRLTGCRIKHASKYLNAVSAVATLAQIDQLEALPFVRRIERVGTTRRALPPAVKTGGQDFFATPPVGGGEPVDIRFPRRYYGFGYVQARVANIIPLHEEGLNGEGLLIAVLDTGFNWPGHAAFDHLNIVAEWDFIHNDPITQDQDGQDVPGQHGHGTRSFGAMAAYMPSLLVSAAWGADYILAKTEIVNEEIQAEEDNYVRALEWADSLGADLVNSSLGYLDWYQYSDMDGNTAVTTIAADIAASKGITIVTAVGNEGPLPWPGIIAPSDGDSVIAVGAVDSVGIVPGFSSQGPTYDGRIKPDVMAQGVFIITANPQDPNFLTTFNGTSAATPIASGAVALLLQKHPNWGPIDVRDALRSTASNAALPNNVLGWGMIDAYAAAYHGATLVTSIEDGGPPSASDVVLFQNVPNPFVPEASGETQIRFVIGDADDPSPPSTIARKVELSVYDVAGRRVRRMFTGNRPDGNFVSGWDGRDDRGAVVSSGVYYYRLTVDGVSVSKRLVVLRR